MYIVLFYLPIENISKIQIPILQGFCCSCWVSHNSSNSEFCCSLLILSIFFSEHANPHKSENANKIKAKGSREKVSRKKISKQEGAEEKKKKLRKICWMFLKEIFIFQWKMCERKRQRERGTLHSWAINSWSFFFRTLEKGWNLRISELLSKHHQPLWMKRQFIFLQSSKSRTTMMMVDRKHGRNSRWCQWLYALLSLLFAPTLNKDFLCEMLSFSV